MERGVGCLRYCNGRDVIQERVLRERQSKGSLKQMYEKQMEVGKAQKKVKGKTVRKHDKN